MSAIMFSMERVSRAYPDARRASEQEQHRTTVTGVTIEGNFQGPDGNSKQEAHSRSGTRPQKFFDERLHFEWPKLWPPRVAPLHDSPMPELPERTAVCEVLNRRILGAQAACRAQ